MPRGFSIGERSRFGSFTRSSLCLLNGDLSRCFCDCLVGDLSRLVLSDLENGSRLSRRGLRERPRLSKAPESRCLCLLSLRISYGRRSGESRRGGIGDSGRRFLSDFEGGPDLCSDLDGLRDPSRLDFLCPRGEGLRVLRRFTDEGERCVMLRFGLSGSLVSSSSRPLLRSRTSSLESLMGDREARRLCSGLRSRCLSL